jgi:hypothetical protein
MHVYPARDLALGAVLDTGAIEHGHLVIAVLSQITELAEFDVFVTIRRVAAFHRLRLALYSGHGLIGFGT